MDREGVKKSIILSFSDLMVNGEDLISLHDSIQRRASDEEAWDIIVAANTLDYIFSRKGENIPRA